MGQSPNESSHEPHDTPPVLDYRRPDEQWRWRPRIPNPAATRSLWCGLGLIGLVVLAVVACIISGSIAAVMMICIAVTWFPLVVGAIAFGVVGGRRARDPDVAGRDVATVGLLLGVAGVIVTALGALGTWGVMHTYGPAGSVSRAYCATNLLRIGEACALYAKDNNGQFPPRFDAVMLDVTPRHFACPGSADTPAAGPTTQAVLTDFAKPGRCSYIYLGGGVTTASPANTPIACDQLENHDGKGIQVLYADGTVAWLGRTQAQAFLAILPPTAQHPATRPALR